MKSMTGYGTAEGRVGKGRLFIEVKAINHRFCEVTLKIPSKMGAIDGPVRQWMQKRFLRGKIEVYMKEKASLFGASTLAVDMELARSYRAAFVKLQRALGERGSDDFLRVVGIDRFVSMLEPDGAYERFWKQIVALLITAADGVERMRRAEGRHIARDQSRRVKLIAEKIKKIKKLSLHSIDRKREKAKELFFAARSLNQEGPLPPEIAQAGMKQDIIEEITRLMSHLAQYKSLIQKGDDVGRRLDFLLQEMHREMNTIGAKASDAHISQLVVDCKAELERLREQVQNVE